MNCELKKKVAFSRIEWVFVLVQGELDKPLLQLRGNNP